MIHPPHRKKSEGVVRYNSDVDDQIGSGDAHHPAHVPPTPDHAKGGHGHGGKAHKPHEANRHHEEEVLGQTDHPKPVKTQD